MNQSYAQFLARKAVSAKPCGLASIPPLAPHLFPFQAHCVDFALRAGRSGLFLDAGLGKTECQLEWCQKAIEATNKPALILTPLAVAGQTKRRAERWGYDARVIRDQAGAGPGINIINYDRLDKIDPGEFAIVSLDEASILKSFSGKTRNAIIAAFRRAQFKLAATATPAPNDHMEFGSYAEFLDVMSPNEMLSRFFINDTSTASQQWRLKGHAVVPFWNWMASWARMADKPSDLGDADDGFILPPFDVVRHKAADSIFEKNFADMFGAASMSATSMFDVKRQTMNARAEAAVAAVLSNPAESWVVWVDTNDEADAVKARLPDAIEVRGSQHADEKEELLNAFGMGHAPYLITKPSLAGFGLDWSHCARTAFVGRTFSYETWYQAIRRFWRFGQKRQVQVHLILAEGEDSIGRAIDRKETSHYETKRAMREAMLRAAGKSAVVKSTYNPNHIARLAPWICAA